MPTLLPSIGRVSQLPGFHPLFQPLLPQNEYQSFHQIPSHSRYDLVSVIDHTPCAQSQHVVVSVGSLRSTDSTTPYHSPGQQQLHVVAPNVNSSPLASIQSTHGPLELPSPSQSSSATVAITDELPQSLVPSHQLSVQALTCLDPSPQSYSPSQQAVAASATSSMHCIYVKWY